MGDGGFIAQFFVDMLGGTVRSLALLVIPAGTAHQRRGSDLFLLAAMAVIGRQTRHTLATGQGDRRGVLTATVRRT